MLLDNNGAAAFCSSRRRTPGNAVAFRRSDNQLTSLEEQGTPQQSDTDQMFDPATKALA